MIARARIALLASLLATLAGCGDGGGGAGGGDTGGANTTTTSSSGGSDDVPCDGAPANLTLEGTWAVFGRLGVTLTGAPGGAISICPADQIGESTMLLFLTIKADPSDPTKLVEVAARLCDLELPVVTALVGQCDPGSQSLVTTTLTIPDALVAALPTVESKPVTGALDGTQAGANVSFERFTVTIGATASGDALPTWDAAAPGCSSPNIGRTEVCEAACVDSCAALRDDDGDGYPGVTVGVCGLTPDDAKKGVPCNAASPDTPGATLQGSTFVDLEVNPVFSGTAKSSCEIEGTVDSKVLFNLVGADVWLAGSPITVVQAINSLPSFQVLPDQSRFHMVRVDGAFGAPDWGVDPAAPAAACAELRKRVNQL